MTGHGPVSVVDGLFHPTTYGVTGPVIAAMTISLAGAALSALMRATNSATGVSAPPHSDATQFCNGTVAVTLPPGALRTGGTPSHR